jgi:KRAB domain-containing zinc finger protein
MSYQCKICNKGFITKPRLIRHGLVHSDIRNHQCDDCMISFKQKFDLNKHRKIVPKTCTHCKEEFNILPCMFSKHVKECKPIISFKCKFCDHYDSKDNLAVHVLQIHGEKPYKCSVCDFTCSKKNLLNAHIKTHGDNVFHCDCCFFSAKLKCIITQHKTTHEIKKCFDCDYTSSNLIDFMQHRFEKHLK